MFCCERGQCHIRSELVLPQLHLSHGVDPADFRDPSGKGKCECDGRLERSAERVWKSVEQEVSEAVAADSGGGVDRSVRGRGLYRL